MDLSNLRPAAGSVKSDNFSQHNDKLNKFAVCNYIITSLTQGEPPTVCANILILISIHDIIIPVNCYLY